jgi:hypothetical protein
VKKAPFEAEDSLKILLLQRLRVEQSMLVFKTSNRPIHLLRSILLTRSR